ncbi:hypothetical protein VTN77DRAFT_7670 [Rasamsonia byssochlamydoides]|uniref:uncharacterized protein n=1 Tax=Rasamsonia byssochlamydoides TaxID=89139 RepID=UPI003744B1C0
MGSHPKSHREYPIPAVSLQAIIWVEWKFLRLLYKRETGQKIDKLVGQEVSKYILGPLTDKFDLDLSIVNKPTLYMEDLLALLHYH